MIHSLNKIIFASQEFPIRTAPHEPFAYRAIKSWDYFRHVISYSLLINQPNDTERFPIFNVIGAASRH